MLLGAAVVLTAASLASLVAGFMYAAGDYPRFGIQEAIGLRLGLLLLAAAVVDTFLERVRRSDLAVGAEGAQQDPESGLGLK